jgi:AcrR family transcriptional regulator
MSEVKSLNGHSASERILDTATHLFSQSGYHGVSTREIASAAQVNEVTIFRHYPHKQDLYREVLRSGLQQVNLRGDLLARIAEASDGREALARTFDLISKTLNQKPEMLRILQYSALEMKADFDPLVREHLGALVDVVARYLEPWIKTGELRCTNTKTVIFALIAILMSHNSLVRVFPGEGLATEGLFEACSDFYTN